MGVEIVKEMDDLLSEQADIDREILRLERKRSSLDISMAELPIPSNLRVATEADVIEGAVLWSKYLDEDYALFYRNKGISKKKRLGLIEEGAWFPSFRFVGRSFGYGSYMCSEGNNYEIGAGTFVEVKS